MAIPVIGAVFMGAFFQKIASFFVELSVKRWAVTGMIIAAMVAAYGTFAAVIQGLISTVNGWLSHAPWLQAAFWILPANTNDCISLMVTAHFARMVYGHTMFLLNQRTVGMF